MAREFITTEPVNCEVEWTVEERIRKKQQRTNKLMNNRHDH